MNIHEAAKLMRSDKWVRRRAWAPRMAIYITYEGGYSTTAATLMCGLRSAYGTLGTSASGPHWDLEFRLTLDDLEADDWEETLSGAIDGEGFDWRRPEHPAVQTCRCHGFAWCKELQPPAGSVDGR